MRRLALLVPVLVVMASGAVGCSDKTNGSAVPENTTTEQSPTETQQTSPRTSDKPTNDSSLKGKDPCTLLPPAGQAQLGISGGEKDNAGSARGCKWRLRGPQETTFFTVDIYDSLGLKDLPNDGNTKQLSKVGTHEAVQRSEAANPGACSVVIGVSESSRVSATALSGTNTQKGCELAMQLAQLVEPELP